MRCVQVCEKVQNMNIWDIIGTGKRTSVGTAGQQPLDETNCTYCGQCITHCPTGALRERNDTDTVLQAINNPDKIVIVQIAPAVRAAWGEGFGLTREQATVGKMVAAARQIGFDYIFDTDFSADLTIMEEANELLERISKGETKEMPMFTSCCPGWVRFMKTQYPAYADCLSTAKSPQQMFGAVAKSYYAQLLEVEPEQIFCVSIMPCTAKKYECSVPQVNDSGADRDVDVALTTREFIRMLRAAQVNVDTLEEEKFDDPLGLGTGAGVIFGATGGVMEAALRSAVYFATGKNPGPDDFSIVRGQDGIREASVDINGTTVRAAIASGLGNARKLMAQITDGKVHYDFVEIMACPGGCAGGGGQPIHDGKELAGARGQKLYALDKRSQLRFSHENPSIIQIYDKFLEKPLSHKSHELLHTRQADWEL
jgi:NADH-quinone oxidoreductase subunit G